MVAYQANNKKVRNWRDTTRCYHGVRIKVERIMALEWNSGARECVAAEMRGRKCQNTGYSSRYLLVCSLRRLLCIYCRPPPIVD